MHSKNSSTNQPQKTSWEPVSSWYDQSLGTKGDFTHRSIVLPGVMKLLQLNNSSVLVDLGCGQGVFAREIHPSIRYTGIDIAPSLVAAAKKRDTNPRHMYLIGDITTPLPVTPQSFSHAICILTLDNIEHPEFVIKNAATMLSDHGTFIFVINHPCFRIPRQSSWEIDYQQKLQYRRINRYLTPISIPISMHPGQGKKSPLTWTYHYPLQSYAIWLKRSGFSIDTIEEWTSTKSSIGSASTMENRARAEFPLFLTIKATIHHQEGSYSAQEYTMPFSI